jgi:hypothetical protein
VPPDLRPKKNPESEKIGRQEREQLTGEKRKRAHIEDKVCNFGAINIKVK